MATHDDQIAMRIFDRPTDLLDRVAVGQAIRHGYAGSGRIEL